MLGEAEGGDVLNLSEHEGPVVSSPRAPSHAVLVAVWPAQPTTQQKMHPPREIEGSRRSSMSPRIFIDEHSDCRAERVECCGRCHQDKEQRKFYWEDTAAFQHLFNISELKTYEEGPSEN